MPKKKDIQSHADATIQYIDNTIEQVSELAKTTQQAIDELIDAELLKLEISRGALVKTQPLSRLLYIENKISKLLGGKWVNGISEYLNSYTTIEQRSISFHRTFNQLRVDVGKLTPARKFVYQMAKEALSGAGLNASYVQPAKYLIMQQVVTGASITEAQKMLKKWSNGELSDGKATMGRETPNLEKYSTQLARDTSYQFNGTLQNIIGKEHKLDGIRYVGDIIDNTRPLCRHLVERGTVPLSEIDALINRYPQGTIKGTNKDNFLTYRGGYSCRHVAYPTKI